MKDKVVSTEKNIRVIGYFSYFALSSADLSKSLKEYKSTSISK